MIENIIFPAKTNVFYFQTSFSFLHHQHKGTHTHGIHDFYYLPYSLSNKACRLFEVANYIFDS